MKINKNGIKLWKEQHLLDDEVANEKYEVILLLQQRNEEIQSCSLQNTEHEGHLQEKKWWNVMHKTLNYKTKMTKSIGKKHVNLIGDKYNLASKNWIDEMIVMVMTKLKWKNPMTKKMKLEKK